MSASAPTRALLTSLSPVASYTLGHALGLGESGGLDHSSTLIAPPRAVLFKAGDSNPAAAAPPKWYTVYSSGLSVCCREVEAEREDHDSSLVFATGFNSAPTSLAVEHSAARTLHSTRCVVGFANGAILLFNPFSEVIRAAASPSDEVKVDDAVPTTPTIPSSSALTPPPDRAERTFNTQASSAATKVSCMQWVPRPRSFGSSTPSEQFVAGLDDGRLLVFDTRVEKEVRLEHPSPALTKAELKARKKSSSAAPGVAGTTLVWTKEFMSVVRAPLAPAVNGGAPAASNPVASWKLHAPPGCPSSSTGVGIIALDFAVSGAFLAVTLSSGHVVVLDWLAERVVACFRTFYGPACSVKWTTDERYLLTGGEDDLLCVWDPFEAKRCVMVGEGHANFLSGLDIRPSVFVDGVWDRMYRAVTIGQDKLLLFWAFAADVLGESTADRRPGATASTKEEFVIDRPMSPIALTSAAAAATQDISSCFVPFVRSACQSMYPMAKNTVAERALCDLASGFDWTTRCAEQELLLRPNTRSTISNTSSMPSALSSANSSALNPSASPTVAVSSRLLPVVDDLLLTVCHGHHIKLWTRIPTHNDRAPSRTSIVSMSTAAASSLPPSTPPSASSSLTRSDTLTSRVMRLNTPVLSSLNSNKGRRV
jgi:WD40 repeat protein